MKNYLKKHLSIVTNKKRNKLLNITEYMPVMLQI